MQWCGVFFVMQWCFLHHAVVIFCSVVQWCFFLLCFSHHAVVFFVFVCIMQWCFLLSCSGVFCGVIQWCFLLCHAIMFFFSSSCSGVSCCVMQWCFLLCREVVFLLLLCSGFLGGCIMQWCFLCCAWCFLRHAWWFLLCHAVASHHAVVFCCGIMQWCSLSPGRVRGFPGKHPQQEDLRPAEETGRAVNSPLLPSGQQHSPVLVVWDVGRTHTTLSDQSERIVGRVSVPSLFSEKNTHYPMRLPIVSNVILYDRVCSGKITV